MFEPLHNQYPGKSKLLNEFTFKFFDSDKVMTKPSEVVDQRNTLLEMRFFIPRGLNFLLAASDIDADVPELYVDYSSNGYSIQLNGHFLDKGVRVMVGRKGYLKVDVLFLIIGAYIDRVIWFQKCANMTSVNHMYFIIVSEVVSKSYGRG